VCVRKISPLTLVLALFSVAGLAACAAPPQPNRTAKIAPALSTSYAPPPVMSQPQQHPPGDPASPSLAALESDPQHFEGLEGKVILAALGDPNFRRRETPAEVWQYYGPGCILDLFLYDDPAAGASKPTPEGKVAHAELRGKEDAPAEAGCLARLVDQHQNRHAALP